MERRQQTADFEIWPENWRSWELFRAMSTSWNVAVAPGPPSRLVYLGLQWATLDSIERRIPPEPDDDVPDARTLFYQLRVLEMETIEIRNSRG